METHQPEDYESPAVLDFGDILTLTEANAHTGHEDGIGKDGGPHGGDHVSNGLLP